MPVWRQPEHYEDNPDRAPNGSFWLHADFYVFPATYQGKRGVYIGKYRRDRENGRSGRTYRTRWQKGVYIPQRAWDEIMENLAEVNQVLRTMPPVEVL